MSYSTTSLTLSNEEEVAADRLHSHRIFTNGVAVNPNDSTLMVELEQAKFGEDGSLDVLVDESWGNPKALAEELHSALAIGKADKRDFPFPPGYGLTM